MDPRIGEIVSELDRLVPADGADVIAVVAAFWQTYPAVARQRHDCLVLATPAGYLRLGIEFLKAGMSPAEGKGPNGDKVPFEIEYLLRKDSQLLLDCERLEPRPMRRPVRPARKFEWQVPDPPAGHEVMALLGELDGLIPAGNAGVFITVPQGSFPSIPVQGTPEGFLRFGLEFARGAVVAGSGQGRNHGEIVALDLDDVLDADGELVFECERIAVLPEEGDHRREGEGLPFIIIPCVLAAALLIYVRAC